MTSLPPVPPVPFYAQPAPTPSPPHTAKPATEESGAPLTASWAKWKVVGVLLALLILSTCVFLFGAYIGHRTPKERASGFTTKNLQKKNIDTHTTAPKKISKKPLPNQVGYVVTLGAFKDAVNAKELVKILAKENIQGQVIQKKQMNAPPIFIVRTRAYFSYASAKAVAHLLGRSHALSAIAVKLEKEDGVT